MMGTPYAECLVSKQCDFLKEVKAGTFFNLEEARAYAKMIMNHLDDMCESFLVNCHATIDEEVDTLLDDVQYNIMKLAIEKEIG
jgi:phosphoribosylformylglycinamidine (FGAM) synthase PurS component